MQGSGTNNLNEINFVLYNALKSGCSKIYASFCRNFVILDYTLNFILTVKIADDVCAF